MHQFPVSLLSSANSYVQLNLGSPKKKYLCLYFGISYLVVHSYLH